MGNDSVLRALTDDGSFRVIAASTTETVLGAVAAQGVRGALAHTFAELLTGAILIRESMSPDLRVQAILKSDDKRSRIVADSHPDGMTRGLVQMAEGAATFGIGQGAVLQVARTMRNGAMHQGMVEIPDGTVSSGLMAYMQESEQTLTMVAVGAHQPQETILAAGGYLLQLLPELGEGPLMVMTERLRDFQAMDPLLAKGHASPEELLAETLYGMPYTRVGEGTVHYGCNCSDARLVASLATLPKTDIESMLADKRPLEIECDFCRRQYRFYPEQLRGLLAEN